MVNWANEVAKRKEYIINDLVKFIQIPSVLNENNLTTEYPFGKDIDDSLNFMLNLAERDGFTTRNIEGYAAHIEYGEGRDLVGVLCHVDVVPEGDDWTVNAFGGDVIDGKIYGRGTQDDKGPTIAAYYAMQIIKDLNLQLSKRVRIILGADEESQWRCVDKYFDVEEKPSIGFAPDAEFPMINAEKGITDFYFLKEQKEEQIISFESGNRLNMVPDMAVAKIECISENYEELADLFANYLEINGLEGYYSINENILSFNLKGISAHGSMPDVGVNAALYLSEFLSKHYKSDILDFLSDICLNDHKGEKLGIEMNDSESGDLTVNIGKVTYDYKNGWNIGFNVRYPVTKTYEEVKMKVENIAEAQGFEIYGQTNSNPHFLPSESDLVKVLSKVYEEQTGEKATLLSTGGGTYARALGNGVAFGALFPGDEELYHQKDEYIKIDSLLKATAIYAQAIYELAK
ncbi:MAG: Xaa-His dipeptidase [Bacillales bacterium]|jgi:succinyl-diaminopimelate desuccinylase|nr:Xaa-His dipeptidase [Bacillales bacterium]